MIDLYATEEKILARLGKEGITRIVVGGIISHENKVLVLKRSTKESFLPNLEEIPSGKVEKQEPLLSALKREIFEETALTLSEIKFFVGYFDYHSRNQKLTRQFNFAVTVKDPFCIKLNSTEHQSYYWVEERDIHKFNISNELKIILEKYWKLENNQHTISLNNRLAKL